MAGGYKVKVDLGPLFGSVGGMADAVFPLIGQAVRAVAEEGAFRWKSSVAKARLWEGEKQPYIESISWQMTGPWSAEISTDYKLAGEIERGRPAKDLKRMLQTSKKTRATKDGTRYLIIPFRHGTPGNDALSRAMPPQIYAKAKALSPSLLLPPGTVNAPTRISASGHNVAQHSYQWGGRLPKGLSTKLSPHHKTDIYAGMVRFKTSTPGAKSSSYLTFRVMSEKSSGWIVPPRPGLYLAKQVAEGLRPVLEDAVGQAVTLKSLRR